MSRRCPGDGEFIQLQFTLSPAELLSAHSMTLLDNRSPLTTSSRHRRRDLRSSLLCSLKPPSTAKRFPSTAYSAGLASKSQRIDRYTHGVISPVRLLKAFKSRIIDPPKTAAAHHPVAPARITSPQTNARHDPKNGQARG